MATVLESCSIQPPPHCTVDLTTPLRHSDILWLNFHPVQRLLFFDFPCSKSHFLESVVPEMKRSLSETLSHFLPLAGKIFSPLTSGNPFSQFSYGDSVSLIIAECDHDFAQLTGNHPRVSDDFYACLPCLPPAKHYDDGVFFSVLALQLTLFPDRGVCVGFTNHHAIGDASSIFRFIKAWAVVNRHGSDSKLIKEKSLLPYFDRTAVPNPDELDSHYWNIMKRSHVGAVESQAVSFPLNKHRATFILSRDQVQKLKDYVHKNRPEIRATTFIVVSALAWVCLARVEEEALADDETEYFAFPADYRGRMKPPLPAEYFGNCLALVKAETTHGLLKGRDGLLAAAQSIAEAIQKTVYNEKGILDGAENWLTEIAEILRKRLFGVAGSPRFDFYDVDYGWGRPKKFESASIDRDTSMSLSKSRDFEGGLEIGLSRPKKLLDAFAAIFFESLNNL